jgi:two-component system cell cycle sensor histidine kinase/response regulator CckA
MKRDHHNENGAGDAVPKQQAQMRVEQVRTRSDPGSRTGSHRQLPLKVTRKVVVLLAGLVLLVSFVVAGALLAFRQIEKAATTREHSYDLINRAEKLLSALKDAETGQRGYLLTGNETFLEPYLSVHDSVRGQLEELRHLSLNNASNKHLDAMFPLMDAKLAEMLRIIELRRANEMSAVTAAVNNGQGKRLMDSIRVEMNSFIQIEQVALVQHEAAFQSDMLLLFAIIVIASVFMLLLVFLFIYLTYREAQHRLKHLILHETQHSLHIQEQTNRELRQVIADHKQVEKAIIRLAAIVEFTDDAIISKNLDGSIQSWNTGAEKMFGYTSAEMVGGPFTALMPADRTEEHNHILDQIKKGECVRHFETVRLAKNGRRIDVSLTVSPIRDSTGKIIGASKIARDITERRQAEESLLKAGALQNAIFNSANFSSIATDAKGVIQIFNVGAEHMLGYTAAEVMNKITPADISDSREVIARAARLSVQLGTKIEPGFEALVFKASRGIEDIYELTYIRKDGSRFPAVVSVTALRDAQNAIIGYLLIGTDNSARKRAEEAMLKAGALEKTLLEAEARAERLQLEAQLIESQKLEVIGKLVGGVAHDFNNILGVIIGYNDLMMPKLDTKGLSRKCAEGIRHAAQRAAGLTRQLLVFSRKQTVQPIVFKLDDVVNDLDKMLRQLIDENIEMTIVSREQIGRVKADAGYVGQVLMNLVVNARDAMPNGGKLTIATQNVTLDENHTTTHKGAIPGDYVMLSVSDTGTGMTDEVQAHLFEAFFTTKPKGKGTGLGLSTCWTVVQQSGGHIGVYSEVGIGTTFNIYFPRVSEPLDDVAKPIQTGPLPGGTETLLIVEDEPSLRQMARSVLEVQGYTVLSASNGQDALRVVREHKGSPIRLVVTDVMMPLTGGKEMAERLKTNYPDIKILFTSGYTDDAIVQQGVLEPGIAFLPKPYTPAALAYRVRAMLDNETDTAILLKQGAIGSIKANERSS